MEKIMKKREVPLLPERIGIKYANKEFSTGEDTQITDLSEEGIRDIVEKVCNGTYLSLFLALDECGEEGYLLLESSEELIYLEIWDEGTQTFWTSFNPEFLGSDKEAPIEPSDGQSVIPLKCTMKERGLAAKCVEWYAHTCEPYPGMDWLEESR